MQKLNILYVAHEGLIGGASKQLITIAKEMEKRGHNVYVLSPFKNSQFMSILKKENIKTFNFLYGWWSIPSNLSFQNKILFRLLYKLNQVSLFIIEKKLRRYRFDIIHSNSSIIDVGAILAKKKNIKHVWHFREYNSDYLDFIKKKKECYDFINNNTNKVVYVSNALKDFYRNYIDNDLGVVIFDGVDEKNLNEKKNNKMKDGFLSILLAASLEENKGQKLAIEAISILKKRGYNNVKLYLAGNDTIGYKDILEKRIKVLDIEDNIVFLNFVKDIQILRDKMNLELICSKYEAFGLSTVEAMMASNPVIGSNTTATAELIIDNFNGYLFEYGDTESLANCIEKFILNPKLLEIIGRNGYIYAKEKFTKEVMINNIEKLYNSIME